MISPAKPIEVQREPIAVKASLWARHEPVVRQVDALEHFESFYPVYRWRNSVSSSILALLRLKGELRLNRRACEAARRRNFSYWSGTETIDVEIQRVGGSRFTAPTIRDEAQYVAEICAALTADIQLAEKQNPGCTNIILCGGKDSLNLLLLPWTHHTVVMSAPPNWSYVVDFVRHHQLPFEVSRLDDRDACLSSTRECLEGCLRMDLSHFRWGTELSRIAQAKGPVVFWTGSLGDLYMTPKWRTVTHPPGVGLLRLARESAERLRRVTPSSVRHLLDHVLEPAFRHTTWQRGAMWQGVYHSILRGVTDSLVLSAYHGPSMTRVLEQVSLTSCVARDVRPLIGERLFGAPVRYPERNPGPPPSSMRRQLSHPDRFLPLLEREGLRVLNA